MTRLFIGTFLDKPDQEKLSEVRDENQHLDELWLRKTRWVRGPKLHLTWLFLGDVNEELIPKVSTSLRRIIKDRKKTAQTPGLKFDKIEVWPAPRKPRSVVLSNKPISSEVMTLARSIRTGLIPFYTKASEQEENRDFRPHITLLRVDRRFEEPSGPYAHIGKKVDPDEIKILHSLLPINLEIRDVCLIQSHLGKSGDYEVLDRVSLSGETR